MEKSENKTAESSKGDFRRWTASRKMEVVLRYMKGEPIDALSREVGIAASQIEEWYQSSLKGIETSLKSRGTNPFQSELDLAKKRIGELSMDNELLREKGRRNGVFPRGKWKS